MNFEEFRDDYELKHPSSVPIYPKIYHQYPWWFRWVVVGMFACAALMSGAHTIPTVRATIEVSDLITPDIRNGVAVISFVAVELAIIASSYARLTHRRLAGALLVVVFIVAVVANITSVAKALQSQQLGEIAVALILGVAAPLIVLLSGEMLVRIHASMRKSTIDADEKHLENKKQHEANILTAFRKFCKEAEIPVYSNGSSNGKLNGNSYEVIPSESTLGHKKEPNARQITEKYFDENPEAISENPVELARKLGVGKSTVYVIRAERTGGG